MSDGRREVVANFDGTPGSHDALRLADALARSTDAELHVAIALPYEPLPLPVDAYDEALEQHFHDLFESAARTLADAPFKRRELRKRSAARALTELAESQPVEALVVGSAEQGEAGYACPDSVGERLLTGAPCAVAIAPRGYARAPADLGTIGVAYDGTRESQLGLGVAERLARSADALLRVIAVVPRVNPMPSRIGHTDRGYHAALRDHFEGVLDEARESLGAAVEAEFRLLEGPPAATLAEATRDVDLIVIGSRGYGPVGRALLGGTAMDLVRTAHSPVLVVPRA